MMRSLTRHPDALHTITRTVIVAVALIVVVAASRARADAPRPTLGGHTFVSTDLVPEAFVTTFVRTSLGYAESQSIEYPPIVIGRDTLQLLNGSLTYATLGIEYQAALRPWIAARISAALVSRLGTESSSLVSEGVTVTQGYNIGFIGRLHQTNSTMLCGTIGATNQNLTIVDVKQFAEDVVNGVPNARLVDDVPTVRTNAGLRFAWAANRSFGFTLLGEGSYGDAPRRQESTSWGWDMGVCADYDANASHSVPFGAALAYRLTSAPGLSASDNGNTSQTVLRLAYSGKHELIAADVLGVFDRRNTRATAIWAGGTAFSMRIYF